MGLRGAVVFVPLLCALWLPGKVEGKYAVCSIVVSPVLVLVFGLVDVLPVDSLFVGILASLLIMGTGFCRTKKKEKDTARYPKPIGNPSFKPVLNICVFIMFL